MLGNIVGSTIGVNLYSAVLDLRAIGWILPVASGVRLPACGRQCSTTSRPLTATRLAARLLAAWQCLTSRGGVSSPACFSSPIFSGPLERAARGLQTDQGRVGPAGYSRSSPLRARSAQRHPVCSALCLAVPPARRSDATATRRSMRIRPAAAPPPSPLDPHRLMTRLTGRGHLPPT